MSDQFPPTGSNSGDQPSDSTPPPSYPTPPPGNMPPPPPSYGGYGAAEMPGDQGPYRVGDALGTGFRLYGKNAGAFILMMLLIVVVALVIGGLGYLSSDHTTTNTAGAGNGVSVDMYSNATPLSLLLNIVSGILTTLLSAALIKGALDAVDGRRVSVGGMFEGWDKLQVLIAAVITGVLTVLGLFACILPGIIISFLLWYTNFAIVDAGVSAIDGIKRSFRFTLDHAGPLLLTALLALVINVVGLCLCGIGLFVSYPVSMLMAACAFRQLQGRSVVTGR